jgi:hypothetical protein
MGRTGQAVGPGRALDGFAAALAVLQGHLGSVFGFGGGRHHQSAGLVLLGARKYFYLSDPDGHRVC